VGVTKLSSYRGRFFKAIISAILNGFVLVQNLMGDKNATVSGQKFFTSFMEEWESKTGGLLVPTSTGGRPDQFCDL